MTTIARLTPFSMIDRLVDSINAALRSLSDGRRRELGARELLTLEDRMLTDIGLTRGDVLKLNRRRAAMASINPLAGYERI